MRVTVVVPTYNEAQNIPVLAEQLFSLPVDVVDLLVVDDGSPDGTGQIAEDLASRYDGRMEVIHRQGKLGLGSAYMCGFDRAFARGAEYIVQMDADLSHSPSYIPDMLRAVEEADLAIGSRYVPNGGVDPAWSAWRKLLSWWGSVYSRAILGLKIRDTTSGFKCFRASALKSIGLERVASNGFAFQVEVNYICQKKGLKIVEIPIMFPDRRMGKSKMSLGIALEAAWRVWQIRWRH